MRKRDSRVAGVPFASFFGERRPASGSIARVSRPHRHHPKKCAFLLLLFFSQKRKEVYQQYNDKPEKLCYTALVTDYGKKGVFPMSRAFVSERKELTLVLPELEYQVLWCVHLAKEESVKAGKTL